MEASRSRSSGVKKGAWTAKEDSLLKKCIQKYGEGSWHRVPARAGLNRCRKSCRLRWINYLNPQIKQGEFCSGEIDLMIKMHKLLGNRWSLIAGRLPGRTANGIKNYWKTHIDRRLSSQGTTNQMNTETVTPKQLPIKPKPHTLSKNFRWVGSTQMDGAAQSSETPRVEWLESILFREEDEKETYAVTSAEEDFIRSFCLDGIQLPEPDDMNQEGASEWNDLCLDFDLWEKRNFNEQLL